MNQPSKDDANGFNDLIKEALVSSARLRHCAATDCRCGQGKRDIAALPDWIGTVKDEATARAYIEGIISVGDFADSIMLSLPSGAREFIALLVSEAAHIGGLLTDADIQKAIEEQAAREAAVANPRPVNSPKPIPNALAFVPGPKSAREN